MMRDEPALYAQFADPRVYMALSLALMVVCMLVSLKVERSRFGMALLAIKQNEPAAEAAGIDALAWKMRAMILSAAMAAAAGGLYAVVLLVVTPQSMFGMLVSAQALVVSLFGGVGVLWGPVIGSVILVPLAETLHAELGAYRSRHPGRGLRRRHHRHHAVGARGHLLAHPRSHRDARSRRAASAAVPCRRNGDRRRRLAPRRRSRRAAARARRRVARLRRAQGGRRGEHLHRGRRDPRHHRAERRRQDHAVQCRQRISRAACRPHQLCRVEPGRPEAARGLPPRHRPHLSGRARLPAHDRARERDRRRLCRRRDRRRGRAQRLCGARLASASPARRPMPWPAG